MRLKLLACTLALATVAHAPLQAQTAPQSAPKKAKYTTTDTTLAVLVEDPAAKAILAKHLPQLLERSEIMGQASGMTLREVQAATRAYAADMLSDKVLAAIDADLAALPQN